jgi:hypothetical protein
LAAARFMKKLGLHDEFTAVKKADVSVAANQSADHDSPFRRRLWE